MSGYPQDRTEPKKPGEQECEWCGDRATKAYEIPKGKRKNAPGTGMFIYTCPKHHNHAEDIGMIHVPIRRN